MRVPRDRYWLFAALSVCVGLAAFALVAELVLRFLPVRSAIVTTPVEAEHPVLRFAPDRTFTYSMGWTLDNVVRGRVNNTGFVNDQDYDSALTTPLLALIGDSYVEALMVRYDETMHGRLAARAGPDARVYSFGVSGAALAQYLMEADFARANFHPDAFVVLMVGNDFDESLLKVRPVPGHHYYVEGPSGLELTRLDFTPGLARRAMRWSALARYLRYNAQISSLAPQLRTRVQPASPEPPEYVGNTSARADSQRVSDSRRVIDQFLRDLPARSGVAPSRILLVIDGIRPQLYDTAALQRAAGSYFDVMRRHVIEAGSRSGYEVLDMQPRLIARHQRDGAVFEFPNDGHWNGTAHDEAAAAVATSTTFRRLMSSTLDRP